MEKHHATGETGLLIPWSRYWVRGGRANPACRSFGRGGRDGYGVFKNLQRTSLGSLRADVCGLRTVEKTGVVIKAEAP